MSARTVLLVGGLCLLVGCVNTQEKDPVKKDADAEPDGAIPPSRVPGTTTDGPEADYGAPEVVVNPATADAAPPVNDAAPPTADAALPADAAEKRDVLVVPPPPDMGPPACSAPASTMCSGTCTNVAVDPKQCGRCGHDCLGGGCADSACEPFELHQEALGNTLGLAIDGANVYWTDGIIGNLWRCPLGGCPAATALLRTPQKTLSDVVADPAANAVFVMETTVGKLTKISASGGTIFSLPTTAQGDGIALDSQYVYWGAQSTIKRAARSNGAGAKDVATGFSFVVALTRDERRNLLFISDLAGADGHILSCPLPDCTSPHVLASGQLDPRHLAVSGDRLFWGTLGTRAKNFEDGGVWTCPTTGACTPAKVAVGPDFGFAEGVTADDAFVYFASGNSGNVYRCPVAGCGGAPTPIARMQDVARVLANDGAAVYWGRDDAVIAKVAK
jgi:hypothetical protein